jgi:hypothetical protein
MDLGATGQYFPAMQGAGVDAGRPAAGRAGPFKFDRKEHSFLPSHFGPMRLRSLLHFGPVRLRSLREDCCRKPIFSSNDSVVMARTFRKDPAHNDLKYESLRYIMSVTESLRVTSPVVRTGQPRNNLLDSDSAQPALLAMIQ